MQPQKIDTHSHYAGPLDWVDAALAHPKCLVEVDIMSDKSYSSLRSDNGRRKWLIENLARMPQPFVLPLLHAGANLRWEATHEAKWGDDYFTHQGTIPLTDLLGLPGENPHQELTDYREFLQYIASKREGRAPGEDWPTVQWFRGGYLSRGLEWIGLGEQGLNLDESERKQWDDELVAWEEKPWFAKWKKTNLDGMARLRYGPHCWFRLGPLRDEQEAIHAAFVAKREAQKTSPKM